METFQVNEAKALLYVLLFDYVTMGPTPTISSVVLPTVWAVLLLATIYVNNETLDDFAIFRHAVPTHREC